MSMPALVADRREVARYSMSPSWEAAQREHPEHLDALLQGLKELHQGKGRLWKDVKMERGWL